MVSRLDEPAPLLFWLPTLWGGAALVLVGSFRSNGRTSVSKAFVIVGGVLGLAPSMWTLVMPLLIITLLVRAAVGGAGPEVTAAS